MFQQNATVALKCGQVVTVDVMTNGHDMYFMQGNNKVWVKYIIGEININFIEY